MTAHLRYQEVVMDIRFPHIFGISLIAVLLATALAFFVRPAFTRDSEFRPPPNVVTMDIPAIKTPDNLPEHRWNDF